MTARARLAGMLRLARASSATVVKSSDPTLIEAGMKIVPNAAAIAPGRKLRGEWLGGIERVVARRRQARKPELEGAQLMHEYGHLVNHKLFGRDAGRDEVKAWQMGRALTPPHLRPRNWAKIARRSLASYGEQPHDAFTPTKRK